MIGPAEIEDMRLDLVAFEDQARPCDAAMGPLNRHRTNRGATSAGSISRIRAGVFARAAEPPITDRKAVGDAGFGIPWGRDEVASPKPGRDRAGAGTAPARRTFRQQPIIASPSPPGLPAMSKDTS
ncbi:hypothetical protein [Methylobacterium soli]|uniref:Uncharacterized protein n=1 Tax=Methylobacterium soli TaxID=553447 RepID=A0A6L3T1V0_9HYPH|nr:hypothetical protein [Methylobacterium soli]KAB1080626.1 hypothetical protein F6X53_05450 [Methylobacterium soli]GJE40845.1 hypothetical protein AEGHOMDF_0002 [Methylobacterium soli]